MERFIFQLHITGDCNCHCKHCYVDSHGAELSPETVRDLFIQYDQLLAHPHFRGSAYTPHVYITGGEPFCHSNFGEILSVMEEFSSRFRFSLLSNGTMLEDGFLLRLCTLPLTRFQVSLDGDRTIHDSIRGAGNFDQVIAGIQTLYCHGIPVTVSFTVNSLNYWQFPQVAEICRTCHVSTLWSDRYVPFCKNEALSPLYKGEMREYVSILEREKQNTANRAAKMRVLNHRALQFLASEEVPYRCTAGEHTFAIDECGNMYPCRRYGCSGGNIYRESMSDIYFYSTVFNELRKSKIPPQCGHCRHARYCRGGAKCQSLATYGDGEGKDPGCWLE